MKAVLHRPVAEQYPSNTAHVSLLRWLRIESQAWRLLKKKSRPQRAGKSPRDQTGNAGTGKTVKSASSGKANVAGGTSGSFCAHADTFRLSAGRIARRLPPVISILPGTAAPWNASFAHSQTLAGLTARGDEQPRPQEPNSSMRSCSVIARILDFQSQNATLFARRLENLKSSCAPSLEALRYTPSVQQCITLLQARRVRAFLPTDNKDGDPEHPSSCCATDTRKPLHAHLSRAVPPAKDSAVHKRRRGRLPSHWPPRSTADIGRALRKTGAGAGIPPVTAGRRLIALAKRNKRKQPRHPSPETSNVQTVIHSMSPQNSWPSQ